MNSSTSLQSLKRVEIAFAAVIRELIANPDELSVTVDSAGSDTYTLRVFVAAPDVGRLVGRQGRTARALRVILGAMGATLGNRLNLDIRGDPDVSDAD